MCLAVPARIISIEGAFAKVQMMGYQSEVYISLIHAPAKGEYVLVHAGCAIEKLDKSAYEAFCDFNSKLLEVNAYE